MSDYSFPVNVNSTHCFDASYDKYIFLPQQQNVYKFIISLTITQAIYFWLYVQKKDKGIGIVDAAVSLLSVDFNLISVCLQVGEVWQSPHDKCVLHQCVKVKEEVFVSATNVSCSAMDTPSCPLGTELRCDTQDCCPHCHCGKCTHAYAVTHVNSHTIGIMS